MITIRTEQPGDSDAIRLVNEQAFAQPQEADVVDRLRRRCAELLSLVAESDGRIVGHLLFSPAVIDDPRGEIGGMGLAPMAVLPEYQRQGIGSQLVESGLEILREDACPFVIVLGHPQYYPRFGFTPAAGHGVECQWPDVPPEAFMILVLDEPVMRGVSGVARYRNEFDEAMRRPNM